MTRLMPISDSAPLASARVRWPDGEESTAIEFSPTISQELIVVQLNQRDAVSLQEKSLGGRYRIHSVLGHGGMGIVYFATDLRLDRSVAIKVLNEQYRDHPEARRLFLAEARQMASLSHPHLVAVHDVAVLDDREVMVTELVRGQDIEGWLASQDFSDPAEALTLFAQLLLAIEYLHTRGIIHRDIKPANAIRDTEGTVKLIDFGLARSLEHLTAHSTEIRGTPAYMAPEQIFGPHLSSATDIYQLGVTGFELLTGELPSPVQEGQILAHLSTPARSLRSLRPDLPPALDQIFSRALAREPSERPTASEFAAVVAAVLNESFDVQLRPISQPLQALPAPTPTLPTAPTSPTPTLPTPPRASTAFLFRSILAPLAALLILSFLALALILSFQRAGDEPSSAQTLAAAPTTADVPVDDIAPAVQVSETEQADEFVRLQAIAVGSQVQLVSHSVLTSPSSEEPPRSLQGSQRRQAAAPVAPTAPAEFAPEPEPEPEPAPTLAADEPIDDAAPHQNEVASITPSRRSNPSEPPLTATHEPSPIPLELPPPPAAPTLTHQEASSPDPPTTATRSAPRPPRGM